MKLFIVKQGTPCRVIQDGQEWRPENLLTHETEHDHTFEIEQIRIDPVGKVSLHKGFSSTIGGVYAKNGYYGFSLRGWVMVVHQSFVKVS